MIENLNYIQANEAINGENGAPGELDVANRPLKELINLFNTGNANTQVRRINFKIPASQMITDGVVSDNVVSFDYITNKYVKSNWQDKRALGIIDVENLIIYSFGEYKLKSINNLIPGKAYFLSQSNNGKFVDQDQQDASSTHIGIAISNDTIEINKYIDATFASVQIDDITPSFLNTYSSNKIEDLLNTRASKIYFFSNVNDVNSLPPAPTSIFSIPLNSTIIDLNDKRIYLKVSNSTLNFNSTLNNAISSNSVVSTTLSWNNITNKPNFSNVATSGSYTDLINKPLNATTTVDGFLSKEDKLKLNNLNPQTSSISGSVVLRDNAGNFSAGTITANLNGNSNTANELSTARIISLTGDALGSVSFKGNSNVSLNVTVTDNSHNHSADNITSGTLPVVRGGTGVTTSVGIGSVVLNNSPSLVNPTANTQYFGDYSTRLATTEFVQQNSLPVGSIIAYASNSTPAGYLKCNGAVLNRSSYPNLFSRIGTTFGAPNIYTFSLPDLRGEFIRGFDDGRGVDYGRTFGSWQWDEFRSHNHILNTPIVGSFYSVVGPHLATGSALYYTRNDSTTYTGGNETRPRNIALHYFIKY